MSAPDLIRAVIHDGLICDVSANLLRRAISDYQRVERELELRVDYAHTVRKQDLVITNLRAEIAAHSRATGSNQNAKSGSKR